MHVFLSDEWFEAAEALRARYLDRLPDAVTELRINQVITELPFGDGTLETCLDTSSGKAEFVRGLADEPDAVVTTDYDTARIIILDQDPALAMQAFMSGKVKVQGDMMKLMAALAAQPRNDAADELAAELRAITD